MSSYNTSYYGGYTRPSSSRLRSSDVGRSIMSKYTRPSSNTCSSVQSNSIRDHSTSRDKEPLSSAFVNKHTVVGKHEKDDGRVVSKYVAGRMAHDPVPYSTTTQSKKSESNDSSNLSSSLISANYKNQPTEFNRTASLTNSLKYPTTNKTEKITNYVPTYYKYSRPTSYSRPVTMALEKHKSDSKIPRFGSTLAVPSRQDTPSPKPSSKQPSPEVTPSPRLSPALQSSRSVSPLSSLPVSSPPITNPVDTDQIELTIQDSISESKNIIVESEQSTGSFNSERSSESPSKEKPPKSKATTKKKTTGKTKVKKSKTKSENLMNGDADQSVSKKRLSYSESVNLTSTSNSSDDDNGQQKPKRKGISRSGSSRTSILASSADEVTFSLDKPARPPPSPRSQKSDSRTEDAKFFLIKALNPVKKIFKSRQSDSSDKANLSESPNKSNEASTNDYDNPRKYSIRRIESGEKPWWLDNDNVPDGIEVHPSITVDEVDSSEKCHDRSVQKSTSTGQDWWATLNDNINSSSYQDSSKSSENWWAKMNDKSSQSNSKASENWWSRINDNNNSTYQDGANSTSENWWSKINDGSSKSPKLNEARKTRGDGEFTLNIVRIRHEDSGEKPWWLSSNQKVPEGVVQLPTPPCKSNSVSSLDSEEFEQVDPRVYSSVLSNSQMSDMQEEPQGDRVSPEGIEDNTGRVSAIGALKSDLQYTSSFTDIDDVIGINGNPFMDSPFMDRLLHRDVIGSSSLKRSECEEINPTQVRIHDSTPKLPVIKKVYNRCDIIDDDSCDPNVEDVTLQVYKDGEFGNYLDLDATVAEQQEEFEGLQEDRRSSLVLRTQLTVRVHTMLEKLRNSQGRELRCALFALKRVFQEDRDIIREFLASGGLDCLMSIGMTADKHFLNYIVRVIGQIMLYVDGMNGIMQHRFCIQWLYSLVSGKNKGVAKTSLKLLLVIVEYVPTNCLLLIDAIHVVDEKNGAWWSLVRLLRPLDSPDSELQIYAMTLINKCLNSIPEQDMYYDETDALERQNISEIIETHLSNSDANLDLLKQFRIYEAVLSHEDGDVSGNSLIKLDETIKKSSLSDAINNNNVTVDANTNGHCSAVSNGSAAQMRRKMRMMRQRSLMMEQEKKSVPVENGKEEDEEEENSDNGIGENGNGYSSENGISDNGANMYTSGLQQRIQNGTLGHTKDRKDIMFVMSSLHTNVETPGVEQDKVLLMKREGTVRDIAQKLASSKTGVGAPGDDKVSRVGDMSGIISKAMKGLAESTSKEVVKSAMIDVKVEKSEKDSEENKTPIIIVLKVADLDFTDLQTDIGDSIVSSNATQNGIPPPPPPFAMFPSGGIPPPPPTFSCSISNSSSLENESSSKQSDYSIKKTKKTMKLFWREINDRPAPEEVLKKAGGLIWDEIPGVSLDTGMIEHLFESRSKEISKEKFFESTPRKEITILEHKRSNAINIVKMKMPSPRNIKNAILKMDSVVIPREGIDKLLTMLPTEEEKEKILAAQRQNPELPLASAEHFLSILASISALPARLKLWAFKSDFDFLQREIAEPMMDLKLGMQLLRHNNSFKWILGAIKSIGEFLNGSAVKGFQIDYLTKVAEVKDTVHKNSLLHHLCRIVMEQYPESTDLFSEIGPVIRASKEDFVRLQSNLDKLATDCSASREYMRQIAKYDGPQLVNPKMVEFLEECTHNVLVLRKIHEILNQRFCKFLLYIGTPLSEVTRKKPHEVFKIIADFALEYRTARERVLIQIENKANHKERNKTLGKMITDVAHAELRMAIQSEPTSNRVNSRSSTDSRDNKGDALLESLAKIISQPSLSGQTPRRTRLSNRKSLRRSRTREVYREDEDSQSPT